MGVDFYACSNCGDTFPDCGDFTGCECGKHWCCDKCAESQGYRWEEDGYLPKGASYEQDTSCSYCRNEDYPDEDLLEFSLHKLRLTRDELIVEYTKFADYPHREEGV